ncbi:DUF885 domain-containing protein [Sphingobium nicotianae]|uniref:DUF885 family protein n=1 Tax=Sphingobium nicotianae TaxID=2782607 RepID=A0A9X1AIF8_9SPHN|nr:DUF885 family protein [Sphingobium nicotianae]MBT2185907.1 DUF885 family protein [Sphingobium nicotianae]
MDRRDFLLSTAATTLAALSTRVLAQGAPAGDTTPALNAAFDQVFNLQIDSSPESATALGLDKGPRAAMKAKLDDNSLAAVQDNLALTRRSLAILDAFKDQPLTDKDQLNLACIRYSQERDLIAPEKYDLASIARPYRIFQQGGAYFELPDFLNSSHPIATKEDCDAYLARLEALATVLDNDSAVQKAYAARGVLAPGWSLDLTLGQMRALRGQPAAGCSMTTSLAERAAKAGIAGDWAAQASKIIADKVYPALDRQIALIEQLKPTTLAGDGVWRLPKGDALYADALALGTTTTMTPEEVHQMGLDQVRDISAQLDAILKANGLTQGSVGARLTALNKRPDQLYPDSAEGRAALIKSLNDDYLRVKALLPRAFANPSNAPLEIRAVPVEIQDGASNGYYRRAALDGSRPAIYFINLKDVGDWPKYGLPSLTYHEGSPGHHLQISTMQEAGALPILRRVGGYSAYSEGWALYAEQLADELGAYRTPLDRAGYLQSFLFRAARLVVDTGIHAKRWSREQATQYMVDITGFAQPRSQREVERYCTQPGQACSYKVGHAAWTRARAKAQATLGTKFDLKAFHEVLKDGAMPLTILEARIEARTKAAMKG